MESKESYYNTTDADDKLIGFEYQYYYFLYLLLSLKYNEVIGLEVKDDIHIERNDKSLILLQLKHSTQTSASGNIINIRERDVDLWKTLYNWINVICDKNDGRLENDNQIKFIETTRFILVSNKSSNNNNKFLENLKNLKSGEIDINQFKLYLKALRENTTESDANADLLLYIDTLKNKDSEWLEQFLKKVEFELNQDDLIEKIRQVIQYEKHIDERRVNDVLRNLDSSLREDNYISIKRKDKIIISCKEFNKRYRGCFENQRNSKLPIRRSRILFPDMMEEQIFIKQLIDIGDIKGNDYEEISEYTGYKILTENNMKLWIQNGELTHDQRKNFDRNSILRWKNCFKVAHDDDEYEETNDELVKMNNKAARKCLNKVREIELSIDNELLDIDLSNGEFYCLSDVPQIGWAIGWKGKYKKND